jgi:mycothiol synthase
MQIRPFSTHDYDSIAELSSLVTPEHPVTAQMLSHYDAMREPDLLFSRWVAEENGKLTGVGVYSQYEDIYAPNEVHVNIRVHPAYRNRGIGAALYDAIIEKLRRMSAVDTMKVGLAADQHAGINFAMRRGFIEYARRVESRAALAKFDPAAFPDPDAQMAEQGITLRSMQELETDPDRDRKLYDLKWEIEQDIPYPGEISQPSFESFRDSYLHAPDLLKDGSFVALDGDQYVGLVFHISGSPALLIVEVTGTARAYRRRGIAQALKLKSMAWAKQAGFGSLLVNNDLSNAGMLAINDKLGFERQPALILFQRKAPF